MSESEPVVDLEESELDQETLDRAKRGQKILGALVAALVACVAAFLTVLYWPDDKKEEESVPDSVAPAAPTRSDVTLPKFALREVASERGLSFRHVNGAAGKKLLPETMGSGAVFFDYDGDGDPDLYLVSSSSWGEASAGEANEGRSKLFRNDEGQFRDVSAEAGLDAVFYGMGASAADIDEDGDPDLFVTCVGKNRLYRNDGGRFVDISKSAGVSEPSKWSTGSAFLDYDGDGLLDLFVCNYVVWSPEIDLVQGFKLDGNVRSYGPPKSFRGEVPELYRNLGGGKFVEMTGEADLAVKNPATGDYMAKSLGVIVCDWNDDGHPDLVVSNDTVQNFAFRNNGEGNFNEVGAEIGVAFDDKGNARGAMGIDLGQYRNDATKAIAIGNFANEMTAFYVDPGDDPEFPNYVDEATTTGIGSATRNSLTFGLVFADLDLDGRLDLVTANGHVEPDIKKLQASQDHAQSPEFFWNAGPDAEREFVPADSTTLGEDFFVPTVGRGLATADIDGDGDLDVLITSNAGAPRLFVNEIKGAKSLVLDLRTSSGRIAWGAKVEVSSAAGPQTRYLGGGRSYLSQSEALLTFGLAGAERSGSISIRWPNGREQTLDPLSAGRHRLTQP